LLKQTKNYQSYKLLISVILVCVTIIALILFQFYSTEKAELNRFIKHNENTSKSLNIAITKALQTIEGLKTVTEFNLQDSSLLSSDYYQYFGAISSKKGYGLINLPPPSSPLSNLNLTGLGATTKIHDLKEELEAALSLEPIFKWVKSTYPNTPWVYYLSGQRFMCVYPYISFDDFFMDNSFYDMDLFTKGLPINNPQRKPYITDVYEDEAGKGLMITIGAPVYNKSTFKGIVGFDLTIKSLSNSIKKENYYGDNLYLVNDKFEILALTNDAQQTHPITKKLLLKNLRPGLEKLITKKKNMNNSINHNNLTIYINQLDNAAWYLISERSNLVILRKSFESTFPLIVFVILMLMGFTLYIREKHFEEKQRATQLLEYQANYDSLTDLPNRHLIFDLISTSVARCRRHGHFDALLYIDLDNFKHINDSLGHSIGDKLLQKVAKRLKHETREEDTSARLGGDEFVILLTELSDDEKQAAKLASINANKINKSLSEFYAIDNHKLHVTPSIGITLIPTGNENADDILKHADTAMYRAKESGRNTYCFYLPSMQIAAEQRLKMQNNILYALEKKEFFVHIQPQVDSSSNIIGAEVLLRWVHPKIGNIPPTDFIPIAEETGQILNIGQWLLETQLQWLKRIKDQLPKHPSFKRLAINISPIQLKQSDFAIKLEQLLLETGTDPKNLTLEFTENVLIDNFAETIKKITTLKQLGIRFSIDDFGTGYSSLSYLKLLPIDEIKIDRSFIIDVLTDLDDKNLVKTIINMAKNLDLEVVAEGVETKEQFNILSEFGCNIFQGYYFSKPVSKDKFENLIS